MGNGQNNALGVDTTQNIGSHPYSNCTTELLTHDLLTVQTK